MRKDCFLVQTVWSVFHLRKFEEVQNSLFLGSKRERLSSYRAGHHSNSNTLQECIPMVFDRECRIICQDLIYFRRENKLTSCSALQRSLECFTFDVFWFSVAFSNNPSLLFISQLFAWNSQEIQQFYLIKFLSSKHKFECFDQSLLSNLIL